MTDLLDAHHERSQKERAAFFAKHHIHPTLSDMARDTVHVFLGDFDDEGVWVYQAFKPEIADWAVEHQTLGGPEFKPVRMTWVKPSFAWVLYRSGYASKHNQTRILRIKVPHDAVSLPVMIWSLTAWFVDSSSSCGWLLQMAELLSQCACKHGGGGTKGRVQWDPERDLLSADGKVPRKLLRQKAIQIGLRADLSATYVSSIIAVEDVTELAHKVGQAHQSGSTADIAGLLVELPRERPYMPHCSRDHLVRLRMLSEPEF
jgi:hypothetical protein